LTCSAKYTLLRQRPHFGAGAGEKRAEEEEEPVDWEESPVEVCLIGVVMEGEAKAPEPYRVPDIGVPAPLIPAPLAAVGEVETFRFSSSSSNSLVSSSSSPFGNDPSAGDLGGAESLLVGFSIGSGLPTHPIPSPVPSIPMELAL
jgi:hypothetical protein